MFNPGHILVPLLCSLSLLVNPPVGEVVYLPMGFRVGEVSQNSAIVWTRLCKNPERRSEGLSEIGTPGPKTDQFVKPSTPVDAREGSVPGRAGQVRVAYSLDPGLAEASLEHTAWATVAASEDFTHQFQLSDLEPGKKYYLRVEARAGAGSYVTESPVGSFETPADAAVSQEVLFTVITGQMYKDLDDPEGFKIYAAMRALEPQFIVPTGDTVYYDNELPRARTVELARYHWHRMYSLSRLVDFHRFVPGYWMKDDHDTLADDTWPTQNPEWMKPMTFQQGQAIFLQEVPSGPNPYRSFRWGRDLQIWLVEGRDFRSPNTEPDGPEKSIWGQEQRDWLMNDILASDATFRILVSPTPIVGPDRSAKMDNHSNKAFAYEGALFRNWTRRNALSHFFVICGDRHWQYLSVDPESGLREFSCGPASDEHAGGSPGEDPEYHRYHRVGGGFLSVQVMREDNKPQITFRFHNVEGSVMFSFVSWAR